jgi:hypothetical protein
MAKLLFNKKVTKEAAHADVVKRHKKARHILQASLVANGIMLVALAVALWLM